MTPGGSDSGLLTTASNILGAVTMLPGIGDFAGVGQAALEAYQGHYNEAAWGLGSAAAATFGLGFAVKLAKGLREGEITTLQLAKTRGLTGDDLQAHELWQHANLKANGLAGENRLTTVASQNNPVIMLKNTTHAKVTAAQRALDVNVQKPLENIRANAQILRDLKAAPESAIKRLQNLAEQHAKSLGH